MMTYTRTLNFADLRWRGCEDPALTLPTGAIDSGTFTVSLQSRTRRRGVISVTRSPADWETATCRAMALTRTMTPDVV
jgi:hypothetical protein